MQKKQQEQFEQLCKTVEASAKSESGKKDSPEVEQRSSKCTTEIAEQGDEADFELTPESEAKPAVETTAVVEAAADPPVGTTEADVDQVNAEAVDQVNAEAAEQVRLSCIAAEREFAAFIRWQYSVVQSTSTGRTSEDIVVQTQDGEKDSGSLSDSDIVNTTTVCDSNLVSSQDVHTRAAR